MKRNSFLDIFSKIFFTSGSTLQPSCSFNALTSLDIALSIPMTTVKSKKILI
jgi:hypothetical protein